MLNITKQYRKTVGGRSHFIDDTIKFTNDKPQYGEVVYLTDSFPIGTAFYVANGHWDGFIGLNQYGQRVMLAGITIERLEQHITSDNTVVVHELRKTGVFPLPEDSDYTIESEPGGFAFYDDVPTFITKKF